MRVVGGDVTGSPGPISLSFTLLGELVGSTVFRREAARLGDIVYVSGPLGDAGLGLQALTTGAPDPKDVESAVRAFHSPNARVDIASDLAQWGGCLCAMDISDGLIHDALRLAQASGVDLEIQVDSIPISSTLRRQPERYHDLALTGGEDYQLLFTCAQPPPVDAVAIGRVIEGTGSVSYFKRGAPYTPKGSGFAHF